jgi:hypothetical protein
MTQTFRVNIDLAGNGRLADFLDTLAEYGSPRIVSYESARHTISSPTMVLEFTSYEDSVEFAMDWFGETAVNAKEYVETITV